MKKPAMSIGIEYLRVVCMFLVIINHIVAQFLSMPGTPDAFREFWKINTPMISFGMPMFFFISGMLMYRQRVAVSNTRFTNFFKKKLIRLMIPYFIFAGIIMAFYRFFDINAILQLNFWHLWFLPTLLWCMTIAYLYQTVIDKDGRWIYDIILMFLCFILPFIPTISLFAIKSTMYWLFTFIGGAMFEKYRPAKISSATWCLQTVIATVFYIFAWMYFPWEYQGEPSLPYMVAVLILMSSVCGLFERIISNDGSRTANQVILFVSAFSFSIYNIHYLIIGLVARRPVLHILNLVNVNNSTPGLLVICVCLIVFTVSLLLCMGWQKLRQQHK